MPAIAMGIIWGGYSVTLWGYTLLKGYNLTFPQLVSPTGYYKGTAWPPPGTIPGSQVFPGGGGAAPAATASTGTGKNSGGGGGVTAV